MTNPFVMTDEEIEKVLGRPVPNIDMLVHQALMETAARFVKEGREAELPAHILEQYKKIAHG